MQLNRKKVREAYVHVFSTDEGKIVFRDLLQKAGVTSNQFLVTDSARLRAAAIRDFIYSTLVRELSGDKDFIYKELMTRMTELAEVQEASDTKEELDPRILHHPSSF